MEKGFFGIFNNKLFMLLEPTDISCVVKDTGNQLCERIEGNIFIPEIYISNVKDNVCTNGELCFSTLGKIEEEKITELPALHNKYRLLIDYQLYDDHEKRVIDEGIITKPIEAINAMIPLGLDTETDELVYRVVKKILSRIVLMYKEEVPYGIMKEKRSDLRLYINRIEVQQVVDYSKDIELLPIKHPHNHHVHHSKHHDTFLHCHHYPNRKPHDENPIKFREEFFTIYDSHAEGLNFNVINISMHPRKIIFDIQILLNNYFFISDAYSILSSIADNYNEKFPPVSGVIPDDKDPDDNDNNSGDDKNDPDNPQPDDTEKVTVEVDKFWVEMDKLEDN